MSHKELLKTLKWFSDGIAEAEKARRIRYPQNTRNKRECNIVMELKFPVPLNSIQHSQVEEALKQIFNGTAFEKMPVLIKHEE